MQHLSHGHRISISTERNEEKQRKLTDLFIEKKKNAATNVNDKFVFTRRILVWLCRDLLPFQLVEKTGFIDFFNSMNRKKTDIPTRQTLSNMALDDMYKCLKTKLLGYLKETQGNKSCLTNSIVNIYPSIFDERNNKYPIISMFSQTIAALVSTCGPTVIGESHTSHIHAIMLRLIGNYIVVF